MWIDKWVSFINQHKSLQVLIRFLEVIYIKTPILIITIIGVITASCIMLGNNIELEIYDTYSAVLTTDNNFSIDYSPSMKNNIIESNKIYLYENSDKRYEAHIISIENNHLLVTCVENDEATLKGENIFALVRVGEQTVWERIFRGKVDENEK